MPSHLYAFSLLTIYLSQFLGRNFAPSIPNYALRMLLSCSVLSLVSATSLAWFFLDLDVSRLKSETRLTHCDFVFLRCRLAIAFGSGDVVFGRETMPVLASPQLIGKLVFQSIILANSLQVGFAVILPNGTWVNCELHNCMILTDAVNVNSSRYCMFSNINSFPVILKLTKLF